MWVTLASLRPATREAPEMMLERSSRPWVVRAPPEAPENAAGRMAAHLLERTDMTRIGLLALVATFTLGACAGGSQARYSHTPKVEVTVKGGQKRAAQANYQVSPEESKLTGAGGSSK